MELPVLTKAYHPRRPYHPSISGFPIWSPLFLGHVGAACMPDPISRWDAVGWYNVRFSERHTQKLCREVRLASQGGFNENQGFSRIWVRVLLHICSGREDKYRNYLMLPAVTMQVLQIPFLLIIMYLTTAPCYRSIACMSVVIL